MMEEKNEKNYANSKEAPHIIKGKGATWEEKGYKGLQEKSLQSRSATASLLIKNYHCMNEEIKLVVFLAQKSRHIVEACGRK